MILKLTDNDYYRAAMADAHVEGLDTKDVYDTLFITKSGEEFFWAIYALVKLKEITKSS